MYGVPGHFSYQLEIVYWIIPHMYSDSLHDLYHANYWTFLLGDFTFQCLEFLEKGEKQNTIFMISKYMQFWAKKYS